MKDMKRTNWQLILILSIMMTLCQIDMTAKPRRIVQRGMTKEEVTEIMGRPKATNFDNYGEQWEFHKTELIGDEHVILVNFDRSGRVSAYRDMVFPKGSSIDPRTYGPMLPSYGSYPMDGLPGTGGPYGVCAMSGQDFNILLEKLRQARFDDDRYTLLEVATLGCYYTCTQGGQLLGIFTFNDDKLRALRLIARHIVDPQNAPAVTHTFTFDSDREKAADIIRSQQMP